MTAYAEFPLSDLPDTLITTSCSLITKFSTGLIKISKYKSSPSEIMRLIGSGTFIIIDDKKFGILTAHHVAAEFSNMDELGLFVSPENQEHMFSIPVQHLRIVNIGAPGKDPKPDLSVIILPDAVVPTIRGSKSFYPIRKESYHPELDSEIIRDPFFICGVPEIGTKDAKSRKGIKTLKSFQLLCGPTGVLKYYSVDKFDYFEVGVEYNSKFSLPETFGGVSGGGVWRVPILILPNGEVTAKNHYLCGCVFYQTEKKANKRNLLCHGPKSIYEIVREKIINE